MAWQNNNRTDAANVASADAVTQMFSQAYPAEGPVHVLATATRRRDRSTARGTARTARPSQMTVRTLTGGLPIQVQSVTFAP